MKPLITLLLLLAASSAYGAVGDFVDARIETNGYRVVIRWSGMSTGGTYAFGLASTNNRVLAWRGGNPKGVLTFDRFGFDDAGSVITNKKVAYLTAICTKQYPNQAQNEESSDGTNLSAFIVLSEEITSTDTNLKLTLQSGLLTASAISSGAATAATVTNNSMFGERPVAAPKWLNPPWQYVTNNTQRVRVFGVHRSAQQGRPVRAVAIWGTDGSNVTPTNVITQLTVDRSMNDAQPMGEYVTDLDISNLANGPWKAHCRIYPWEGGTSQVADTTVFTNTCPSVDFSYHDHYKDFGGAKTLVAVVSTNGTSGGSVLTWAQWQSNTAPAEFDTINRALAAIVNAKSNSFGITDARGCIVFLKANPAINWCGGTANTGNQTTNGWTTFTPYPGVSKSEVVISTSSSSNKKDGGGLVHLKGLTISSTFSGTTAGGQGIWIDDCTVTNTTDVRFVNTMNWAYWTGNYIYGLPNGIGEYTTNPTGTPLVRGNRIFSTATGGWYVRTYAVCGNYMTTTGTSGYIYLDAMPGFSSANPTKTCPNSTNFLAYNNVMLGNFINGGSGGIATSRNDYTHINSGAVIQNLYEKTFYGGAQTGISIPWAPNTGQDTIQVSNVVVLNGVFPKGNWAEHASGTSYTTTIYKDVMVKNIVTSDRNWKSDVDYNEKDGSRYGNWKFGWGVNCSGTYDASATEELDGSTWKCRFPGISSYQPPGANTTPMASLKFVDSHFPTSVNTTAGGNYRLKHDAPAQGLAMDVALAFDIEGNPRGAFDPPGVYYGESPRRTHGYFGCQ